MKCLDLLNNTEFFNSLTKAEIELVIHNSTSVTYNKGDSLVKEGEFINSGIFICGGYVKIHLEYKRRSIIFNILGPNNFAVLGQMISLDKQPFSITAIDETTVCLTDINIVRQLTQVNARFASFVLDTLNKSVMAYINQNFFSLTQNNIHGRLASILIYLAENVFQSNTFDMLLSRKELSQFCNISRENVIKVLYEFNNDGLIHLSGKKIHIHSPENLRRIANLG